MNSSAVVQVGAGASQVSVRQVRRRLRCVVGSVERVLWTIWRADERRSSMHAGCANRHVARRWRDASRRRSVRLETIERRRRCRCVVVVAPSLGTRVRWTTVVGLGRRARLDVLVAGGRARRRRRQRRCAVRRGQRRTVSVTDVDDATA